MDQRTDHCEALVREADKDRFLATLFAPAQHRPDLLVLYAFDLETAAVAHRVRDPVAGEIRLQWWHDVLSGEDSASGHPVADAMMRLIRRDRLMLERALGLIDARRRALYQERGLSEAEFELSASETAGAIFLMAGELLGGAANEAVRLAAHHAGVAAAASHLSGDDAAFDAKAVAKRHRAAVRDLIAQLPPAVLPAFLPLALSVEGRTSLPQWRKQWILWRASRRLADWV
jgi:phytoene synthase